MRRLLLAALLLASSSAYAQIETTPPSSAGSFTGGTITAPILGEVSDDCSAPSFSFSDAPTSGLCHLAAGMVNLQTGSSGARSAFIGTSSALAMDFISAGALTSELSVQNDLVSWVPGSTATSHFRLTATDLRLASSMAIGWSSSNAAGALDIGLRRGSAGFVQVTNGSTGNGGLEIGTGGFLRFTATAGNATTIAQPSGADNSFFNFIPGNGSGSVGIYRRGSTVSMEFAGNIANYINVGNDIGITRTAASVLKVTNGSSGSGDVQIADGTSTQPSLRFTSQTNTGFYGQTGLVGAVIAGTEALRISGSTYFAISNEFRLGSAGVYNWASTASPLSAGGDTGLKRSAAAVVGVTNGSSGDGKIQVGTGCVTNTGYGFAGFATDGLCYDTTANDAVVLLKGNIQREMVTGDRTLTDATATTIFQIAIADANMVTLAVDYHVRASNATPDYQAIGGTFYVSIVNKGGTETCSTVTEAGEQSAVSAGTITFTATCDTSPANAVNIQVNSDSSLTTPTITGQFIIRRSGTGGSITIS